MEKQTGPGSFSKHVGQKFGKKLGREISRKGEAIGQKFDAQVDQLAGKVTSVASNLKQTATDTAKTGIDQILLNLEHRGLNIKDKQEIIHRVGQTVLDRAEKIRSQITENSPLGAYAPSWMKESLKKTDDTGVTAEAAGSMTEATVSEPAAEMQPEVLSAKDNEHAEDEASEDDVQGEFPGAVVENSTETKSSSAKKPTKSSKSKSARSSK